MAATSEKSTLEIEVVTKGIGGNGGAVKQLNRLGESAEQVEPKITRLTTSIGKLITQHGNASAAAQRHYDSIGIVAKSFGAMSQQMSQMATQLQAITSRMDGLTNASISTNRALEGTARAGGVVNTTLRAMATAASAYLSLNFVGGIIKAGDAWVSMQSRLKLATGSLEEAKKVQGELFDLAQKLRAPLEDMGKLFTRMSVPMQRMGKDHKETAEQVEFVALALKLQGATAAEASSVMLQYSQAVNAGRLNGAEFNAVSEAAPSILRAIEAELAATGEGIEKTGKTLKQMGADGEITFELISRAAKRALPQMREDFKSLPVTVDDALTRVKNAWFKAMGELGEDTQLGKKLGAAISKLEESIPAIRDAMVETFLFLQNNLQTILGVFAAIVGLKVFGWAVNVAQGLMAISTAATAAGGGVALLTNAWRAFLGPIGLATAAVGAAITAYQIFSKEVPKAEKAATDATNVQTVNRLKLIQQEIDKINELTGVKAGSAKPTYGEIPKGRDEITAKEATILKLLAQQAKLVGDANKGARDGLQITIDKHEAELATMRAQQRSYENTTSVRKELEKQASVQKAIKDFNAETATDTEKGLEKIKAMRKAIEEVGGAWTDAMQKRAEAKFLPKEPKARKSQAQKEADKADTEEDNKVKSVLEEAEAVRQLVEAQKMQNEQIGLNAAARANLEAIRDEAKAADLELLANTLLQMDSTNALSGAYMAQAEHLRTLARLKREGGQAQDELAAGKKDGKAEEKAMADLDKFLDPSKALAFGDALASAFGRGGSALKKLTSSLGDYSKRQSVVATMQDKLADIKDEKKRDEYINRISKKQTEDQIKFYGDITGAAKDFFKEGTQGYAALSVAEQAFRSMELALAIQNNAEKLQGVWTYIAAKGQEVVAMVTGSAVDSATTGVQVKNSMTKAGASTKAGVAKSFEQLGVYGFVGAAAILAFMLAMGVSGGSGSKPNIPLHEQRQKRQGTGTVLGDEDAKSQSLGKAIDRLARNADITLQYTSNMLMTLQAIRDGIQGMAKFVSRAAGIRGTAQDEMRFGVGEKPGGIFKSSKKTELLDSGIEVHGGQTVGGVTRRGSVSAEGYADVRTTKSNWWSGSKSKTKHHVSALEQDLLDQMGKTVTFFQKGIVDSVESLGGSGSQVKKMLEGMSLNIGKISLKGKTGEEVAAELEAIFSSLGDRMAKSAFKGLEGFEKNGEGYFETLVKVATGVEKATYSLDQMGVSAIHYSKVVNKQGDVATEIVRQSLQASTSSGNIRKFLGEMNGSAEELIETYKKLVDVTQSLKLTGIANDISRALIRGAGGLDSLQSHMSDFIDGMFTDEERQAMSMSKLRTEFAKLNIAMPNSKESFKALVKTLMAGGQASQEMAGKVLALSGVFVDAFDPVFEQLEERVENARSDLSEAYERESEALTTIQEKFLGFSESLKKFRDSLLTGDLSTLSVMEKYQTAAAKYQDTYARAMTGDEKALSEYESVASEFLKFSREMYSSSDAYTADFERVLRETEGLQGLTEAEADKATQSLNLLKDQVAHLISIDESTKTVAEALVALNEALAAAGVTPNAVNVSHIPEVVKEVASPSIIPEKERKKSLLSTAFKAIGASLQAAKSDDPAAVFAKLLKEGNSLNGSHANGLDSVPFDGYIAELHKGERVLTAQESREFNLNQYGRKSDEALVSEIKALRQELAAIKEERREQTAAIIASNYDANERNAQSVVEGVKESAQDASYYERTKTGLV